VALTLLPELESGEMTPTTREATFNPSFDPAKFLSDKLEDIKRIARSVCRRHAIFGDDVDDFIGLVELRLTENDFAILRKFEGRCSWNTYLTTVISNLERDDRISKWGRWRASSQAKRRGPLAVRLECLIYRDGHTLQQAVEVLRSAGVALPPERELARLAGELFRSSPSRRPAEIDLEALPGRATSESVILASERQVLEEQIRRALDEVLNGLDSEDQVIIRLRYVEGMKVSDIARVLSLNQKPLYRRVDTLCQKLRGRLRAAGVDREMVAEMLDATSWE
jgi:RNA polymerase sigma factor (sigma-70 family)